MKKRGLTKSDTILINAICKSVGQLGLADPEEYRRHLTRRALNRQPRIGEQ